MNARIDQKQIEAVAEAIGCPEWTGGCDRRGECFCATAAQNVVAIERSREQASSGQSRA